jgi:hypothetical protein
VQAEADKIAAAAEATANAARFIIGVLAAVPRQQNQQSSETVAPADGEVGDAR